MKWLKTCPKSASYVCQRIFVAFGKVNNSRRLPPYVGRLDSVEVKMTLTQKDLAILDKFDFDVQPVGVKFLVKRPDRLIG